MRFRSLKTKTYPWWQNTVSIEFRSQCHILLLYMILEQPNYLSLKSIYPVVWLQWASTSVPSVRIRPVTAALQVIPLESSSNPPMALRESKIDLDPDFRTVSGASPDTCQRQLVLGVGGSGRSPLECTTSEIRAGARAGVAFSSSRAARSLSGTARIRSYVVGDTKIVNCRFQSLLKSIESDPSANRLASNFQATPAQSS